MADQLSIIPDSDELKTLPADGGPAWNRLVFESSPYLLQHAANPVDWRPWGAEAFEQAQTQDKPIFLSIGYATCHWCHVMEHESFEDRAVAELMNRYFICIKVDKEERPDIDDIYMNFCQAMTGQGGWPLTAILAPDRRPWFCGTYFPKFGRSGRPGMMELLPRLHEVWTTQRGEVTDTAQRITEYVAGISGHEPGTAPNAQTLQRARDQLAGRYDQNAGGFGSRPKFPSPHNYTFLLRHWKRSGDPESLAMVVHSLKQMRKGGIFDHVGFGFHRYSTDQHWLLPHFEKMLYDQATLAIACLEAGQASGDSELFQICREIFTYVLRDMTSPEGGFYSAEDADSEGVEGKFYVWTPGEVKEILGSEEGQLFCQVFQIEEQGNFFEEATGHKTGDNIAHLKADLASLAKNLHQPEDLLRQRLERSRRTLFAHRELRIHPLKDDKILTDWNGLMITALALGSRLLGETEYLDAAIRAADFILKELRTNSGSLLKRYRKGKAGLTAHLDDYAFMIQGLIELYQACFNSSYLETALKLTEQAVKTCWNDEAGAFYLSSNEGEELIVRGLRIYDGAIPSGNSAMACNLLKLTAITGNLEFQSKADRILKAFAGQISAQPATSCQLMSALDFQIGPSTEIVLVGEKDQLPAMMAEIDRFFLPNKVVLYRDEAMAALAPYTRTQTAIDGQLTAYVCRNFSCHRPTTDAKTLETLLSG